MALRDVLPAHRRRDAGSGRQRAPRPRDDGYLSDLLSDDAYAYDRNPNTISAQSLNYSFPAQPEKGAPKCMGGQVGVAKNGVPIFNGLDAGNRDAAAWEVQDECDGHPQQSGQYHYHSIPACMNEGESKSEHSKLVGWALDGFPIYGPRGEDGEELTNNDLDVCHGHTHKVKLDGEKVRTYHYHGTAEYPYTVGCFRGPASSSRPSRTSGGSARAARARSRRCSRSRPR